MTEDYIQIPEPSNSGQQIAVGQTLIQNIEGGQGSKVLFVMVDLPPGVTCTISRDNSPYWFYSKGNEKGMLRFRCGIEFQKLTVTCVNQTSIVQDLHVRLLISFL